MTNLHPVPGELHRGVFIGQLVRQLSKHHEVHVVVPLPTRLGRGRVEEVVVEDQPVTIVRYGYIPFLGRRIHAQLMLFGVRSVVARLHAKHGFDVLNAHWLYPDGVAAEKLANELGMPLVLTARGCDVNDYLEKPWLRGKILASLKAARCVTAVSRQLVQRLEASGVPTSLLTAIPNGVDRARFRIRSRSECRVALGLPEAAKLTVAITRLSHEKGVEFLIRAMCKVVEREPRAMLRIVGSGALQGSLMALVAQLGLTDQQVRFVGSVRHDEVPIWLGAADVVCLPSLREGYPNAVVEALACGRPVVASAVGAVPSLLNGDNGTTVPPADPMTLGHALSEALARTWSPEAVCGVSNIMSWTQVAEAYETVYQHATAARLPAGKDDVAHAGV